MQKGQTGIFILAGILFLLAVVGGAYYLGRQAVKPQDSKCTLVAKICPDGSSVGRTGPNCEFAQCSVVKDQTISWSTYKGKDFTFKYPPNWVIDEEFQGEISIHDPDIMYGEEANGGFMIKRPRHFFSIFFSKVTNKTAKQSADEFIDGWSEQISEADFKRESYTDNGMDYEIYENYGEAEVGRIIDISNGKMLISINSSLKYFKDNSIEAKILSTLKF